MRDGERGAKGAEIDGRWAWLRAGRRIMAVRRAGLGVRGMRPRPDKAHYQCDKDFSSHRAVVTYGRN